VAGFGGDIVVDYYLTQKYGVPASQERQDTGGVIDEVAATANTASREVERAHEERRQQQERIDELEAEVQRLRAENARFMEGDTPND
jgi:uncharacterized coiled-coil DUF342 family protein